MTVTTSQQTLQVKQEHTLINIPLPLRKNIIK